MPPEDADHMNLIALAYVANRMVEVNVVEITRSKVMITQ